MKNFIGKGSLKYGWLILFLLLSVLLLFSCEEATGPEETKPTLIYQLLIYPENSAISTGGSTRILVKVCSGSDTTNAISGVSVNFSSTTQAVIQAENNITDSNGYARARLLGGLNAGTVDFTASIQVSSNEKYSNTTFITVTPGTGFVTASPTEILADGISQSIISAAVIDSLGQPLSGIVVKFETTDGTITPQSVSDNTGKAMAVLTSVSSMTDIFATVTASTVESETASVKVGNESIAKMSKVEDVIGSITVLFKGIGASGNIVLQLNSSPSVLSANGKDTSTITALVSNVDGNPIDSVTVYFSTTDGIILPSAETDQWGEASVNLRSSRYNAIAQVTATYGVMKKTINIEFSGATLSLLATPLVLVANDIEKSKLSITYNDASGAPIVDEVLTISTTRGTLYTADFGSSGVTIVDSTSTKGKVTAFISSVEEGDALITVSTTGSQDSLTINFTNFTFSLVPEDEIILAGGDTTYVTAVLRNIEGTITSIDADKIDFSTTLGIIGAKTENEDGSVRAELISGKSAGTATISASITVPPVTSSISVIFKAADADSIWITSDKPTVKLGGNSVSIQATVFDVTGNPKSGETVTFSILKGPGSGEEIIPGTAVTSDRGQAVVSFRTGNRGSERDGVEIQAKHGNIYSNIINLTISGEPKSVKAGYKDSYTVNEDGTCSVEITAIVADVNRNEVVDGTIVNFSLEGDAGVIAGQVPTVDGVATTNLLYSPSDAGKEVVLTASAGGEKDVVRIPLPGFEPSYFSIVSEPKSIPADGKSKITIHVTLFDKAGSSENVPDGTMVAFTTEGGTLEPAVARTVNGVATTILKSDKNPAMVKVTAQSGDYVDFDYVTFEEVGSIVNEVSAIALTVDDPELRANGIASTFIRATLKKFDGTIVTTPTTVGFETDIGEITQSVLSDSTTGTAVAQFSSNTVGTAQIKVSVGAVFDYINVFLVPGPPLSIDLEFEPKTVGIQGSGRNVTLIITAFVKDDKNNAVADNNLVQFELIGFVDSEASLSPSIPEDNHVSEPVPTVNGSAKVAFHAGTASGTVRIKATIIDEDGNIIIPEISSETTEFQVFSGPPYLDMSDPSDPFTESRMTLSGGPLNIYAGKLNTEDSKSSIGILVGDKYNNPVPAGTAVWISTTGGIVTTSTGFTESVPHEIEGVTVSEQASQVYEGLTYVTLYAANPSPTLANSSTLPNPNASLGGPATFNIANILMADYGYGDFDGDGNYNNGIAIVSAYSKGLDNQNRQVIVWNYVPIIFSLGVNTFTIVPDVLTLGVGETTYITLTIHDKNGNPIVGGSEISFETNLGVLSETKIVTGSPGVTHYRIALTNNLDPDTDEPGETVVTARVSSPNGNVTALSDKIQMLISVP